MSERRAARSYTRCPDCRRKTVVFVEREGRYACTWRGGCPFNFRRPESTKALIDILAHDRWVKANAALRRVARGPDAADLVTCSGEGMRPGGGA